MHTHTTDTLQFQREDVGMTKSISVGLPRVSVIIPHLNTPELLVRCLQSVAGQRIDYGWFEIIVVDNG